MIHIAIYCYRNSICHINSDSDGDDGDRDT